MDTTSYLALSSQVALQRHMTNIANNLANVTTTGYCAEHTLFGGVLERVGGSQKVSFVQDRALSRDTFAGPVVATGNTLDLAIGGDGYLTFATADGRRYGRSASLSRDATGQLVDASGNRLLDDAGNPIVLAEADHEISISPDGVVTGRAGRIARVAPVTFADDQRLERVGDNLYRTDQPPTAGGGKLVQGALEGSNVRPALEMTTMLETVRAFEGAQKLLDTQHEIERQTTERTVRSGG